MIMNEKKAPVFGNTTHISGNFMSWQNNDSSRKVLIKTIE